MEPEDADELILWRDSRAGSLVCVLAGRARLKLCRRVYLEQSERAAGPVGSPVIILKGVRSFFMWVKNCARLWE